MRTTEFQRKQARLREILAKHKLDALLLQRVSSFAWATCGAASYVNMATTMGASSLLITPSKNYVITNNIEGPRLDREEQLLDQGWEFRVTPWHETQKAVSDLTVGMRIAADGVYASAEDLSHDVSRMRVQLELEEIVRLREVGSLCAEAVEATTRAVRPGQTEYEIAGLLAQQAQSRGVQPIVNLVATDGRIYSFRHPLPTAKKVERYALIALSGRRSGLVCSVTRLVHFGRMSDELNRRVTAAARVDATLMKATRPGRTLGTVLKQGIAAYADAGFPEEWHMHHQGGAAGYESREYLATPSSTDVVSSGQAYAWNPSIAGAKSEDTILVTDAGQDVVTSTLEWPTLQIPIDDQIVLRPAVLIQ